MGSPEAPAYTSPNTVLLGNRKRVRNTGITQGILPWVETGQEGMPGGEGALSFAESLMKSGLPAALKEEMTRRFQGSIGGGLRTEQSNLGQRFARMGNVPIGAVQNAYGNLQDQANNATNDFYGNLISQDFGARQTGFGDWNTLMGTAVGAGNAQNTYAMEKYKIDSENSFSIGKLMGSLMQAGGQVGGGMASAGMCCFIFMEAYNGKLPWWVRECRDEFAPESSERRAGYIRMAGWLVPKMNYQLPITNYQLKRAKVMRFLVNQLMIKPMTKWGGWYKNVQGYEKCWIYKPVVWFWFWVWKRMGRNILEPLLISPFAKGRKERYAESME